MASPFTLGIEEEFQMVDRNTGQLVSRIESMLEKGEPLLGDHLKSEMLQSFVELSTAPCPNLAALRLDLCQKIATLARLADEENIVLVRAGTHPLAHWLDQCRTRNERYEVLEEDYQDVGRSILIFGLHVHVGIPTREMTIPLMNQLRTWIPHMLALSSNSPFWIGRNSGLRSYRAIVWKRFPRSGIPGVFSSTAEFEGYVANLVARGCIDNGKRIWWDIRPHPFFGTIEFRMCDMPPSAEVSLALAALCQALVAKLAQLYQQNVPVPVLPTYYIEENKWRAARYGLDAEVVDFSNDRTLSMRDSIAETLDFVDDVLDELDIRHEIDHLRSILADPHGTGADRQLAIYRETGSVQAVTRYLMQRSLDDVDVSDRAAHRLGA
jgi:carboxylate-amine ligase